jgi:DNA-binding CsgD family transcriptional regulator
VDRLEGNDASKIQQHPQADTGGAETSKSQTACDQPLKAVAAISNERSGQSPRYTATSKCKEASFEVGLAESLEDENVTARPDPDVLAVIFGMVLHCGEICNGIPIHQVDLVYVRFEIGNRVSSIASVEIKVIMVGATDQLIISFAGEKIISAITAAQPVVARIADQAIGQAVAAVVQKSGRVLAVNNLLESLTSHFRPAAFGHLALVDPGVDRLFKQSIANAGDTTIPVRSIPLPATEDRLAAVIHVLPLVRSAHEIFSSGDMLVIANLVSTSKKEVPLAILTALFDLAPSEAKLAARLAMGSSVSETAAELGVTVKTARTYLERVFAKTGTHRQSDLIRL